MTVVETARRGVGPDERRRIGESPERCLGVVQAGRAPSEPLHSSLVEKLPGEHGAGRSRPDRERL